MKRLAFAVETSSNAKLGTNVSATYASQESCPDDCPFLGDGCYGEYGHVGIITGRLNDAGPATPALVARQEAAAIDGLSGDHLLRLHVVGDCRTTASAKNLAEACERYALRGMVPRRGKKAWTYTHAWHRVPRDAWGDAVSVLASCQSVAGVKKAMARGYAVALIVPQFQQEAAYDYGGLKLLPCPWQTRGITCKDCKICLDDERLRKNEIVVGFTAHGAGAKKVREKLISLPTIG